MKAKAVLPLPRKRSARAAAALNFVAPPGSEDALPAAIDRHFAALMVRLHGAPFPELEVAAQMVSAWRGAGHSCLPLAALEAPGLIDQLRSSPVVGAPGQDRPLILDDADRLYLQRYWAYERTLSDAIAARLGPGGETVNAALLTTTLDRYLPGDGTPNQQREAAAAAVQGRFSVITGGPGTGKTRTVVVILAALIEQAQDAGRALRVALAAPTGKAAARLQQAIHETALTLPLPAAVKAALPTETSTIHRLLGSIPGSGAFRHHAGRQLPIDVLIVDEASMVDLALMAKLLDALPPESRVVLLGDKDQLASVEAGYVLGDICQPPEGAAANAPLRSRIVELRKNYRFKDASAIHRLSGLINAGQPDAVLAFLRAGADPAIRFAPAPPAAGLVAALRDPVRKGFEACLKAGDPREALSRLSDFRLLCALRHSAYGVASLNRAAEQILAQAGLINPGASFYAGRPIIILRNSYSMNLFNGDIGMILPDPTAGGALRAFFVDAEGELRRVLPARLPEHETVFAMTVHKSQGSEFRSLLFVLPERDTPVASRELVYTAITRAREAVELWAGEGVLREAIARTTIRSSGLCDALWMRSA